MKKLYALITISFISFCCVAQNVGIGTLTPSEKLDVNGNINVSGQVKVNGNAGTPNQILKKDATNNPVWSDLSQYKNIQVFDCPNVNYTAGASNCPGSWLVPAGVTTILVECWGGGGGANNVTGGAGAGYVSATLTVVAGNSATLTIGAGGNYGSSIQSSVAGGNTSFVIGAVTLTAYGGSGGVAGDPLNSISAIGQTSGGSFSVSGITTQYIGFNGSPGGITKLSFMTAGASDFAKVVNYGDGGDAALLPGSGGKGGFRIASASISQIIYASQFGIQSGGGGGADASGGFYGLGGRIIIHW